MLLGKALPFALPDAAANLTVFVPAGYRLLNGEGDGLPGLTCDVYDSAAVLKLDGAGPEGFYDAEGIAEWLMAQLPALKTCYLKYRSGSEERGRLLRGDLPRRPVRFSENGVRFQADIVQGQKTGGRR